MEDEILGTYRDVRVNIVEANLETGGKNSRVVFNGLLAELAFPGRFPGVTIVAKDGGLLGNAVRDFVQAAGLERVRLEDPRFEEPLPGLQQRPDRRPRAADAGRHAAPDGARAPHAKAIRRACWRRTARCAWRFPRGRRKTCSSRRASPIRSAAATCCFELSSDIGSVLKLVDAVLELTPMQTAERAAR